MAKYIARGPLGAQGQRCPSPTVRGAELEAAVWDDIEMFLAKPDAVIQQLSERRLATQAAGRGARWRAGSLDLEPRLKVLDSARQMALRQLTRGRITELQFDKEIGSIDRERTEVEGRGWSKRRRSASADQGANALALGAARSLLEKLPWKNVDRKQHRQALGTRGSNAARLLRPWSRALRLRPSKASSRRLKSRSALSPHCERYVERWRDRIVIYRYR